MSEPLEGVKSEPATTRTDARKTEVGSVFVSNYPPYSAWSAEAVPEARQALDSPSDAENPLGLYLHIPFCRKRCKFCYFRVYTDKNSNDIQMYLDALAREIELYSETPSVAGRSLYFVYFGGGTPSYISVKHLRALVGRIQQALPWDRAKEIAFECEPGTLTRPKLEAIKELGITRLSLGVENLNDEILNENGRAHLTKEIYRVVPWIHDLAFDQLNVDLIAGMVGETWETWRENVQKILELDADSITVYQMELPFNTVYSKDILGGTLETPVADWKLKREWHDYAFEQFAAAGYAISSAYTMVKPEKVRSFVYRDAVWHGADMLGTGIASFSHMNGVHFQNVTKWEDYLGLLAENTLPTGRAFATTPVERLTREMILQLKLGSLDPTYFQNKFGVDILEHFSEAYQKLRDEGMLIDSQDEIRLTREGLLRVDQLLPEFYAPRYQRSRYT